ncbi:hypothetical protein [Bacillus sp. Marseille-Q3570]|uniref:hypothetical protein n=1 Tax=Bacillus sp. Marseille-Q3570 TaxID=2963522 RepID=UPI0021B8155F|nr:hypothetical protein [Bacillus sp. Marseille-Q3570]
MRKVLLLRKGMLLMLIPLIGMVSDIHFLLAVFSLLGLDIGLLCLSIFVFINWKNGVYLSESKRKSLNTAILFFGFFLLCLYHLPDYIKDTPLYINGEIERVEGIPTSVEKGYKFNVINSITLKGEEYDVGNIIEEIPYEYRNRYFVIYYLPNTGFTVDYEIHDILKDRP